MMPAWNLKVRHVVSAKAVSQQTANTEQRNDVNHVVFTSNIPRLAGRNHDIATAVYGKERYMYLPSIFQLLRVKYRRGVEKNAWVLRQALLDNRLLQEVQ